MQNQNFDTFDTIVFGVMAGLMAAIVGVVLAGNNIGVQIESAIPNGTANSSSLIAIRFFDEMDTESVETRFTIDPPLDGEIVWRGNRELLFRAADSLVSGETYTVTVGEGAESSNTGARLNAPISYSFTVSLPRVAYLAPAGSQQRDIYLYDLTTNTSEKITDARFGVADYEVAPDNSKIAYTRYNEQGTSDIWLYDMETGSTQQLTNCVNASCGAPSWSNDGAQLAYEREEYDVAFGQPGARRVWLIDLVSAQTFLLFDDTQITGHSPKFAPSGNRIAMFSSNPPGILVYDFVSGSRVFVENLQGVVGNFSPEGDRIVYPILVRGAIGSEFYSQLEMVDFEQNQRITVTGPAESPIEDKDGVWRPQHPNQMVVTRRYFDDRSTDFSQVYLLDTETNDATPLIVDNQYSHGALAFSPDGNLLAVQRFEHGAPGARPQIWVYNMQTESLVRIQEDAYFPNFVP